MIFSDSCIVDINNNNNDVKVEANDCCAGIDIVNNNEAVNWGTTTTTNINTAKVRSYLSLDGLEDYTKRMKELIDKKLEVVNERLKKLEDGEVGGKFAVVRGWMVV